MKKQFLYLLVSALVPLCHLVVAGAQENMTAVDNSVFVENPSGPRPYSGMNRIMKKPK